jgi:RNA polymerase sigma factor (sigma-70 family)
MGVESLTDNRQLLIQFLEAETDTLAATLRMYNWRAGLPSDEDAASELLNAVVIEALEHAARFDPSRPPRAWLLGIAANLVRQQQTQAAKLNRREPLIHDMVTPEQTALSEDELFDCLVEVVQQGMAREVEERSGLAAALALLSPADRQIVRLYASGELDGDALAQALHVTPGAARVRLHRALTRLRRVWSHEEEKPHDQS